MNDANPTRIKPIIPINRNIPRNDRFLTVLYPNSAMHANIIAASTNADRMVSGLFVIATNNNGVITMPNVAAYTNNSAAARAGDIENARAWVQIDNANPPNSKI